MAEALHDHDIRLVRVETELKAVHAEVSTVQSDITDIKKSVDKNHQTATDIAGKVDGLTTAVKVAGFVITAAIAVAELALR